MSEIDPRSVAILAVGTEVTEGQIIDRNSAWLADECARMGLSIVSHRCVPDDRVRIRGAIEGLLGECRILFITGGLGPTSDDFTRDLVADAFAAPLEFDESSWRDVQEKLRSRGVEARDAQKQQCWFPRGSRPLANAVGTANGFRIEGRGARVFVLPGPPVEVAAVFEAGVRQELAREVPESEKTDLRIWRCLGRGESDLAELVEVALAGSGLVIGYRAHAPYVEVKVWVPRAGAARLAPWLTKLEDAVRPWLVNRDDADACDSFFAAASRAGFASIHAVDGATGGLLLERTIARIRVHKQWESPPLFDLSLSMHLRGEAEIAAEAAGLRIRPGGLCLSLAVDVPRSLWTLTLSSDGQTLARAEVPPPYVYALGTERARKFIAEKAFVWGRQELERIGGGRLA